MTDSRKELLTYKRHKSSVFDDIENSVHKGSIARRSSLPIIESTPNTRAASR